MIRRRRLVPRSDTRSPMLRLLQDCQLKPDSDGNVMIAVAYDQQWRTLWKAERLGYVDAFQHLTDKGRAFIERESAK